MSSSYEQNNFFEELNSVPFTPKNRSRKKEKRNLSKAPESIPQQSSYFKTLEEKNLISISHEPTVVLTQRSFFKESTSTSVESKSNPTNIPNALKFEVSASSKNDLRLPSIEERIKGYQISGYQKLVSILLSAQSQQTYGELIGQNVDEVEFFKELLCDVSQRNFHSRRNLECYMWNQFNRWVLAHNLNDTLEFRSKDISDKWYQVLLMQYPEIATDVENIGEIFEFRDQLSRLLEIGEYTLQEFGEPIEWCFPQTLVLNLKSNSTTYQCVLKSPDFFTTQSGVHLLNWRGSEVSLRMKDLLNAIAVSSYSDPSIKKYGDNGNVMYCNLKSIEKRLQQVSIVNVGFPLDIKRSSTQELLQLYLQLPEYLNTIENNWRTNPHRQRTAKVRDWVPTFGEPNSQEVMPLFEPSAYQTEA